MGLEHFRNIKYVFVPRIISAEKIILMSVEKKKKKLLEVD